MHLVSKISNLCDPDPPTSQTDGQTDDMRSQDHALHYSASRGNKIYHFPSNVLPNALRNLSAQLYVYMLQAYSEIRHYA